MSDYDKLALEAWNVWDLDHLMAGEPNEITAAKITARVAAAIRDGEERGRRRGVIAQWGKIHELLALVDELADDLAPFTGERVGAKWNRLRAGIEDLAPRDSGKETLCPECSQPVTLNADGSVPIHARGGRFACALGWPTGDRK